MLGARSSLIDRNVVLQSPAKHSPAQPCAVGLSVGWQVLVGKGIVYDTGGLSIKSKEGMPGMKTDMGGAAAVLQAPRLHSDLHD